MIETKNQEKSYFINFVKYPGSKYCSKSSTCVQNLTQQNIDSFKFCIEYIHGFSIFLYKFTGVSYVSFETSLDY